MTEAILTGIIVALLAYHFFYVKEVNKERAKLLNAVLSKNAVEFRDLELTDKVATITPQPTEPDLIPESDLTDEEFSKVIKGEESA